MRHWTSVLLYSLIVIVPTALVTLSVGNLTPLASTLLVSGTTVGGVVALLLLQRVLPAFAESWRDYRRDVAVDLIHGVVSTGAGKSLADAIVGVSVAMVAARLYGDNGWLQSYPILMQFIIALCAGELGTYWAHRLLHHNARLWPIHAVHHSPERMSPLAAARTHPINTMIAWVAQSTPMLLIGVDPAVIVGTAMFTSLNGLVQHCNIDLQLGKLEWIIAGPNFHRWHHSQRPEHYRRNLASNLSCFDWFFGTFHLPTGVKPDENVGVPDTQVTRGNNAVIQFLNHMLTPFLYGRWVRETQEEELRRRENID